MVEYIILAVFVLVVIALVYSEYRSEKKYQEEKRQRKESREEKKQTSPDRLKVRKLPPKEADKPKEKNLKKEKSRETIPQKEETLPQPEIEIPEEKPLPVEVPETEVTPPEPKKIELPDYLDFDHSRLIEMGLPDAEAREYVKELIPQVEAQIPLIKEALDNKDFHAMEKLTHSIKGSSTTVGTGGISALLSDYNTYLKQGTDPAIAEAYLEKLEFYKEALIEQYA